MAPAPVRHHGLLRVPPAPTPTIARRQVDRVSSLLRQPGPMECSGIRRDPRQVVGLRDEHCRLGTRPVRRDVDHHRARVSGPAGLRRRRLGRGGGRGTDDDRDASGPRLVAPHHGRTPRLRAPPGRPVDRDPLPKLGTLEARRHRHRNAGRPRTSLKGDARRLRAVHSGDCGVPGRTWPACGP